MKTRVTFTLSARFWVWIILIEMREDWILTETRHDILLCSSRKQTFIMCISRHCMTPAKILHYSAFPTFPLMRNGQNWYCALLLPSTFRISRVVRRHTMAVSDVIPKASLSSDDIYIDIVLRNGSTWTFSLLESINSPQVRLGIKPIPAVVSSLALSGSANRSR